MINFHKVDKKFVPPFVNSAVARDSRGDSLGEPPKDDVSFEEIPFSSSSVVRLVETRLVK